MNNMTESSVEMVDSLNTSPDQPTLTELLPSTILLGIIFLLSVCGNVITCVVIATNRYMHTVTNYYLFSLSLSDLLLVMLGLPLELHQNWFPSSAYSFGAGFCVVRALAAETSTNASVLTILAFTVERYLAICRPLLAHTVSQQGRAIRHIVALWIIALACATLPTSHFGIKTEDLIHTDGWERSNATGNWSESAEVLPESIQSNVTQPAQCTVVREIVPNVFVISTVVFFIVPMVVLAVLYIQIGLTLARASAPQTGLQRSGQINAGRHRASIVRMLLAVVVAFFICWAPFHAQRLLATYVTDKPSETTVLFGQVLYQVSGVLYYVSTCINPILYQLMSARFQAAFRDTFGSMCSEDSRGGQAGTTQGGIETHHLQSVITPSVRTTSRSSDQSNWRRNQRISRGLSTQISSL